VPISLQKNWQFFHTQITLVITFVNWKWSLHWFSRQSTTFWQKQSDRNFPKVFTCKKVVLWTRGKMRRKCDENRRKIELEVAFNVLCQTDPNLPPLHSLDQVYLLLGVSKTTGPLNINNIFFKLVMTVWKLSYVCINKRADEHQQPFPRTTFFERN
jgi:hypothetical protein